MRDTPKKLEKRLLRRMGWLNRRYNLIRPGDHLVMGISGGKDSLVMALLLQRLAERAPFRFTLEGITLNQGLRSEELERISHWMAGHRIPYTIQETNIAETVAAVVPEGKSPCSACARFRRGILYDMVHQRRGVLALGHHGDDAAETLLLNIFFTGKLQAMPPVLISDDQRNRVVRPMLYLRERDIATYAANKAAPVVGNCSCPGATWVASSQRQRMKELIRSLEERYPETCAHILGASANVKPSNLMDDALFNFVGLTSRGEPHKGERSSASLWKKSAIPGHSQSLYPNREQ